MTPVERYRALLNSGALKPDPAQANAAEILNKLHHELQTWRPARPLLFGMGLRKRIAPKGIYVFGDVGRGKSALMDLFFQSVEGPGKRRIHFNEFMADTHGFIHSWRSLSPAEKKRRPEYVRGAGEDPIAPAARRIASSATLLCLDEFQVTDVADAMILGRLFEKLLEYGAVSVVTSNSPPDGLYERGINRELFLPFIAMIQQHFEIVELTGALDYRLNRMAGLHIYNTPLGPGADRAMDEAWQKLTDGQPGESLDIEILGRKFEVPKVAEGVARFSFDEVCGAALGPPDYLAIADHFHAVLIDQIPQMGPEKSNEARRFTWLIDTLYDRRIKVICSAAARPELLYVRGDNVAPFRRTASRLLEMQSVDYLVSAKQPLAPAEI
ncbi:MAG TPA: cell division protein ZapE [Micropepsaceae bacterium]|nr:cell division protein ZapE [Micropepsaceae bacterium]